MLPVWSIKEDQVITCSGPSSMSADLEAINLDQSAKLHRPANFAKPQERPPSIKGWKASPILRRIV